jgi:quercetin dioxygenase-like cupin family protein
MMNRLVVRIGVTVVFIVGCATSFVVGRTSQAPQPRPHLTSEARGGLRMLLDQNALGGPEVSVGERTYPPNYESAVHTHQSIELLYVLSGDFQHVVNGQTHRLGPGMLGFVKPGDKVQHRSSAKGPVKVLMIWVPGADGEQLANGWRSE